MLFSNKKSVNIHLILKIKFLFSQLLEIIVIIFVLNIGLVAAMSAKTNQQVEGSLPYLLFNNVKVTTTSELLGIKVPDDTSDTGSTFYIGYEENKPLYPNTKVNKSSDTKPIIVPAGTTFGDIQSIVPLESNDTYPSIPLRYIASTYGQDDDGDAITAYGDNQIMVIWRGDTSISIDNVIKQKPHEKLKPCVVYTMSVGYSNNRSSFELRTKGKPSSTFYPFFNINRQQRIYAYYYIAAKDNNENFVCYTESVVNYKSQLKGSADWDSQLFGFRIHNSSTIMNFPTTGAKGLTFNLYLNSSNITVEEVIAINGTTVLPFSGDDSVKLLLKPIRNPTSRPYSLTTNRLQVELDGPSISDSGLPAFKPTIFKLYANSDHSKVLYSFKLERWYIYGSPMNNINSVKQKCQSIGDYRLADINELTNAYRRDVNVGEDLGVGNKTYMMPSYKKDNGSWFGGIFNEWGPLVNSRFWWNQNSSRNSKYIFSSSEKRLYVDLLDSGSISKFNNSNMAAAYLCVSP